MGTLGKEEFGLYALTLAVLALSGPANLGMGTVTLKFVSALRGAGETDSAANVVRKALAWALLTGFGIFAIVAICADILAAHVFSAMGDSGRTALALRMSGMLLLLSQADIVFASAIKGCERYDIAALTEMLARTLILITAVAIAWTTGSALAMLGAFVGWAAVSCVFKGFIVAHMLGATCWRASFSAPVQGNIMSFAGWSWVQAMAGTVFQIFDRLLVASALGAASLAAYTVCTQLASQIHAIPAAAMSFLFPLLSRKIGAGEKGGVRRIENLGVCITLSIVFGLAALLALLHHAALSAWLGTEFADSHGTLFLWILLAYAALGVGIAPYYLLMGRGDVKFVSLVGIGAGAVSLVAMVLLVQPFGEEGVAWARSVYLIPSLLMLARLIYLRRHSSL